MHPVPQTICPDTDSRVLKCGVEVAHTNILQTPHLGQRCIKCSQQGMRDLLEAVAELMAPAIGEEQQLLTKHTVAIWAKALLPADLGCKKWKGVAELVGVWADLCSRTAAA